MESSGEQTAFENVSTEAVVNQYIEAYDSARKTIAFGDKVKLAGIIIGNAWFLATVFYMYGMLSLTFGHPSVRSDQPIADLLGVSTPALVSALLWGLLHGLLVGGAIFLTGVLLMTLGHTLIIGIHSAVYQSPFLTDEDKAKALVMPEQRA